MKIFTDFTAIICDRDIDNTSHQTRHAPFKTAVNLSSLGNTSTLRWNAGCSDMKVIEHADK